MASKASRLVAMVTERAEGFGRRGQEAGGLQGVELRNKPPHWNESLRCWCLNFRGRVKLASVKNFQLIASTDPTKTIVMQASLPKRPIP